MLADLIHHVRQELTQAQINQTVSLYIQNLHDNSLAPSIQTMCAKLLLNLIDCIINNPEKSEAQKILYSLLDAFTNKFTALKLIIPKLERRFSSNSTNSGTIKYASASKEDLLQEREVEDVDIDTLVDIEHVAPIRVSTLGLAHEQVDIIKGTNEILCHTLI